MKSSFAFCGDPVAGTGCRAIQSETSEAMKETWTPAYGATYTFIELREARGGPLPNVFRNCEHHFRAIAGALTAIRHGLEH